MEFPAPLTNLKTQICVIMTGYASTVDREAAWPAAADEFLRRLNKMGIQITIVGPRPPRKFGSKKTVRFMDRHEVVGMKVLAASRSHRLEFRILNQKTKAWTRLRAEACVTLGAGAVWPIPYEGWTSPGTLTLDALARWVGEQKWSPGREFIFLGSSNRAVRWASTLLDRGATSCVVVEPEKNLRCWRSHRDRLLSKGGRILANHKVEKILRESNGRLAAYLNNDQGTMILNGDTVVLCPTNDDALNAPEQWRKGMFYVQRRGTAWDQLSDEEQWLERLDWRELYWRVSRVLGAVDYGEAEGALRGLRSERRTLLNYRREPERRDFAYSGKILARESLAELQKSPSVPHSFAGRQNAVASLECLENVPCRACVDACPEGAITMERLVDLPTLIEDKCIGCGACVAACPAGAAVMVREMAGHQRARYVLPDDTKELWKEGRSMQLLNRRGEVLGTGRVVSSAAYEGGSHRLLEIESTDVHVWEARGFRAPKSDGSEPNELKTVPPLAPKKGWVLLNGVRRLCPVNVPITVALWQLGQRRFEEALFCHDGGCRLCEVIVDGRPVLACQTSVRDGQEIGYQSAVAQNTSTACPCRGVPADLPETLKAEGLCDDLMREVTGFSQGKCHGRWCLAAHPGPDEKKLRPVFHGYETSPWRDIWALDVTDSDSDPGDFSGQPPVFSDSEASDSDSD